MRIAVVIILSTGLLFAQSLRQDLGRYELLDHVQGEIRVGYILHNMQRSADSRAFGLGGISILIPKHIRE